MNEILIAVLMNMAEISMDSIYDNKVLNREIEAKIARAKTDEDVKAIKDYIDCVNTLRSILIPPHKLDRYNCND